MKRTPREIGDTPYSTTMVTETPSDGVPMLRIADNHAAVRANPAIAGTLMHATAARGVATTLIVAPQTRGGMLAAGGAFLMRYQHRSPTG